MGETIGTTNPASLGQPPGKCRQQAISAEMLFIDPVAFSNLVREWTGAGCRPLQHSRRRWPPPEVLGQGQPAGDLPIDT